MASQKVSRAKDLYTLMKNIDSLSAGQARVLDYDCDTISYVTVEVTPSDGIYRGGTFVFEIGIGEEYPGEPPQIRPLTKIYHPNILPTRDDMEALMEESGDDFVCVSMINDWNCDYGLQEVIQALLFLLYNPNRDDPLNSSIGSALTQEEFERNVKISLGLEEKSTDTDNEAKHDNSAKNEESNEEENNGKAEHCCPVQDDDEDPEYFEEVENYCDPAQYDCQVKWGFSTLGVFPEGPSPTLDRLHKHMEAFKNEEEQMEMDSNDGARGNMMSQELMTSSQCVPCIAKQYSLHHHLPCVSYSTTTADFVTANGQYLYKHYDVPMVF